MRRSPISPTKSARSRHQKYLRAQGPVSALGRKAVSQAAPLRGRQRRRQSGQGLAAAQFHHLPLGYRYIGGGHIAVEAADGMAQLEKTGRVEWVSDLAEIPAKYGVNNVYADLGQLFASTP